MVGNRSTVLARTCVQVPALIPGPRTISGTRMPPSHTVPFPFASGPLALRPCAP